MAPHGSPESKRELAELANAARAVARRRAAIGRPAERRAKPTPPGASRPPAAGSAARVQATVPARTTAARPAPSAAPSARAAAGPSARAAAGPAARTADDVRAQAAAATTLDELRAAVSRCEACELCRTRTQTVFMDGEGAERVLFVGEAPGAEEDRTGVPFVGRAGQLLTDIITKGMGIARNDVWIANVLKCRPPENRDPTTVEKATCTPWLDRQIEILDPQVIIPLGRHAAMHMLQETASMGAMRGKVHVRAGKKIVPTFHPAYLLRNPADKKECWKDIRIAMNEIGLPVPPSKSPLSK